MLSAPDSMVEGFLPCFSHYCFSKYPVSSLFASCTHINRLKRLLASMLDARDTVRLAKMGIGKHIQPVRPTSLEARSIIDEASYPYPLYRIDYGDNAFRIVFGIQNSPRLIHMLMIDTKHRTFSGKNKR